MGVALWVGVLHQGRGEETLLRAISDGPRYSVSAYAGDPLGMCDRSITTSLT